MDETRVCRVIQFGSHVAPPSNENDCSQVAESGVMSFQVNRTFTGTPSMTSSHSNTPTPSSKRPRTGGSRRPSPTIEAHQIRHRPVRGS
jgi:hypothetical protein